MRKVVVKMLAIMLPVVGSYGCSPDILVPSLPQIDDSVSVIIPSDTMPEISIGGKDEIMRDSIQSVGKDKITLPGFLNPTPIPKPINKPSVGDRPNGTGNPTIEVPVVAGVWRATNYITELCNEQDTVRMDSVSFAISDSLILQLNEDSSFVINYWITDRGRNVEGCWECFSLEQLVMVFDSGQGWSETYIFEIGGFDENTLILLLVEPQMVGSTCLCVHTIRFVRDTLIT
ncbi:MAG: hypothetical protein J6K81_07050 [Rikenellaceae bacterium]|nr:hypothetical protein [Rikenellaceae bacterium]